MILKAEDQISSQILCDRHTSASDLKMHITKYEAVEITLAHKLANKSFLKGFYMGDLEVCEQLWIQCSLKMMPSIPFSVGLNSYYILQPAKGDCCAVWMDLLDLK